MTRRAGQPCHRLQSSTVLTQNSLTQYQSQLKIASRASLLESADHARSAMQSARRLRKMRPLFNPTGAVRAQSAAAAHARSATQSEALRADSAQSPHVVCTLTSHTNSKFSKKKNKKKKHTHTLLFKVNYLFDGNFSSSFFTLPKPCQDLNLGLLRGSPMFYQLHHRGHMKLDLLNH